MSLIIDVKISIMSYLPYLSTTYELILLLEKKRNKGKMKWRIETKWTYYYFSFYFFFKVLDANNKKTMSSSQQEFLFFDTIVHDGEIEQVIRHNLRWNIILFLFLFSRFFKSMKLNSINQYISMKFVYYQLVVISTVWINQPHVWGRT
jgi:hypothetical protein